VTVDGPIRPSGCATSETLRGGRCTSGAADDRAPRRTPGTGPSGRRSLQYSGSRQGRPERAHKGSDMRVYRTRPAGSVWSLGWTPTPNRGSRLRGWTRPHGRLVAHESCDGLGEPTKPSALRVKGRAAAPRPRPLDQLGTDCPHYAVSSGRRAKRPTWDDALRPGFLARSLSTIGLS
jgi:hypothetical protein